MVTGLGDRLKEARKAKGYTLEDLQEITKIQKRYLLGIENEEFKTMPGAFYVRAFIKQYAEAVDLNADELLALYKGDPETQEIASEEESQVSTTTSVLKRSRSGNTRYFNEVLPKAVFALFIIVILLVVAFLWKHNVSNKADAPGGGIEEPLQVEDQSKPNEDTKGDNKKAVADEKDKASKEDEEAKEEPEEEPKKQTIEHLQVLGADATYVLKDSDVFKIEVRTSGPSWIAITDENGTELTPEARAMNAGETVEVDATNAGKVRIRVGRTAETEIYVNGELLEYASDAVTQNIHLEYPKE